MEDHDQKWMSHLAIVRHGESMRNVAKSRAESEGRHQYGGSIRDVDVDLTERGVAQAEATGLHLSERFRFDIAYTSPYRRTRRTAECILESFHPPHPLILEERLREKEFGILDGITRAGLAARFPEEMTRRQREGKYYYRPPGGESYPDVNLRIHAFLAFLGTLTREWRGKSVLVVCHSVVVLSFRRLLERLTEQELLRIDRDPDQEIRNCSITRYEFDPHAGISGKLVLREFNATDHLAALGPSGPERR
ncbi:MAG: histidine phosphatase family protein [Acidobacteriota bacterium]